MRASLPRGQGRVCEPYLRGTSRDEAARIWHLEVRLSVSKRTLCDEQMCLSRSEASPSSETDRGAPSRTYSQRLQTKENQRTLKNSVQRK